MLDGGAENDLIAGAGGDGVGGAGAGDTLIGGAGSDWVDYIWSTDPVTLSLNCGAADGDGDTGLGDTDVIQTMENATLTADDDSFTGNQFGNAVQPDGGQNTLEGDCVANTNPGGDTLDYSVGYDAGVTVNMAGGSTGGDPSTGFENVKGTDFADNITGNDSSNTIKTGKGNDNVKAGAGDDTVGAGGGNDAVRGGSGDDDLFGRAGNDNLNGARALTSARAVLVRTSSRAASQATSSRKARSTPEEPAPSGAGSFVVCTGSSRQRGAGGGPSRGRLVPAG